MEFSKGVFRVDSADFNIISAFPEDTNEELLKVLLDSKNNLPPLSNVKWYILYKGVKKTDTFWCRYRELTSMADNTAEHYRSFALKKKNGGIRRLHRVSQELQGEHKWILENILSKLEVSKFATAYIPGMSTKDNARPHIGNEILVKMDIEGFFDNISMMTVCNMLERETNYNKPVRVFLAKLCTLNNKLPQGASTSPTIANLVMKDADERIGRYCEENNIEFTRYSDDLSFSCNDSKMDVKLLINTVKRVLKDYNLKINWNKLRILHKGDAHKITGIVCNEKLSIDNKYKKQIRQEVYYIEKYSVESHIIRMNDNKFIRGSGEPKTELYLNNLLGRINYVLSVEADNLDFQEYRFLVNRHRKKYSNWLSIKIRNNYYHHQDSMKIFRKEYRRYRKMMDMFS